MDTRPRLRPPFLGLLAALAFLVLAGAGCASRKPIPAPRAFDFQRDTFAFPNQTFWVYRRDPETGRMTHEDRVPRPTFAHRCFVVVRAAREFQLHARFDPDAPRATPGEYRRLVRRIVGRSSRRASAEEDRVVIPGFADLRSFSAAFPEPIQDRMGGPWQSYVQRGHWRMVFSFGPDHQEREANLLAAHLSGGAPVIPAVLHIVRFPALTINHALLAYAVESTPEEHRFRVYDPNDPAEPLVLTFDRRTRCFDFPATPYFVGGRVDVYEVYRSAWY